LNRSDGATVASTFKGSIAVCGTQYWMRLRRSEATPNQHTARTQQATKSLTEIRESRQM
jgi:hypothetical protein